jgi:hypothetical protein
MKKLSDPSSGFTLAGEPGKQSQKVPPEFSDPLPTGSVPAKSRQQHIFLTLLLP